MKRRDFLIGLGGTAALAGAGVAGWRVSTGSMADYARYCNRLRAPLSTNPVLADLIRYATLAANSHNTQPWRFHPGGGKIDIRPDFARRTPAVDPDDHHLFVSLGRVAAQWLHQCFGVRRRNKNSPNRISNMFGGPING